MRRNTSSLVRDFSCFLPVPTLSLLVSVLARDNTCNNNNPNTIFCGRHIVCSLMEFRQALLLNLFGVATLLTFRTTSTMGNTMRTAPDNGHETCLGGERNSRKTDVLPFGHDCSFFLSLQRCTTQAHTR